ncbi:MAG: hypothetical protein ACREBR_05520 [bacterium]
MEFLDWLNLLGCITLIVGSLALIIWYGVWTHKIRKQERIKKQRQLELQKQIKNIKPFKTSDIGYGAFGLLLVFSFFYMPFVVICSFWVPTASSATCYMGNKPIYLYGIDSVRDHTFDAGATLKSNSTEYQCTSVEITGRTPWFIYLLAPLGVAITVVQAINK